jgi:hypothetical protein
MSGAKPTGGPAFPVVIEPTAQGRASGEKPQVCTGLTIRDSFAIAALQGALSGALADGSHLGEESPRQFAEMAYKIADAMMTERAK